MKITNVMLGAVLLFCTCFAAAGQQAGPPAPASATPQAEISFQFERKGLPVPHFILRLHENGTGTYQADQAEIPASQTSMRGQSAQHIERSVNLTPGTVANIFKGARTLNRFSLQCASKAKNIADTGAKTLTYSG